MAHKYDELTFDEIVNGKGTVNGRYKQLARGIECADGTMLSVQASWAHYCSPRINRARYESVEVALFEDDAPPEWNRYLDGKGEYKDHVQWTYGYVPVKLVREYIESHGGEA